jgi:hypothetical protein
VTITVDPQNQAPTVDAGTNQFIALPTNTAGLDGTVSDDGWPRDSTLTQTWSKDSGPGTVTFANANAVDTTATFSTSGTYVLKLSANDTALTTTDTVTVTVDPQNQAPTVEAGTEQKIGMPTENSVSLDATVSDDGWPRNSTLTQSWSKDSGPGTVTFANANAVDTTATFSTPGTYVLKLSANDTALTTSDTVTIKVFKLHTVPSTGLQLHLDGPDPDNSSGTWLDSSGNDNDATMSNTTFTEGEGYAFSSSPNSAGIFTGIQPQTADKFAFAVRFIPDTQSGQPALLAPSSGAWSMFYLDYGNHAVAWEVYTGSAGYHHFRDAPAPINPDNLSGENMIGVTWETTSGPGGSTGTARIYLNGDYKGQVTGAYKPTTDYPAHSAFDRVGRRGSSDNQFDGDILQVVIYKDYSGTADDLMYDIYNGTE